MPPDLRRLAILQSGVVSRAQVVGTGLSRHALTRLVGDGTWMRLSSGVYLTSGTEPTWLALVWAGVLIGGHTARVGGRAAACLHGLTEEEPRVIEVLVSNANAVPRVMGPWTFRRERAGARLRRTPGSPPRITVEDVVLDLVAEESDDRAAIGWVTGAVQRRLTTPHRLREAMASRHFVANRRLLDQLLDDVGAGAQSPLEVRYLRDVERAHHLPVGKRQVRRRGTACDVLYEEFQLVVELDGRVGHEGIGRFRDMNRDNVSTSDGLATLRYGHADVFGMPCQVATQVSRNLQVRGWAGIPTRCDRCRAVA